MQFGDEGLDRANKLLKQQLSASDARISALERDKKEREDKLEEVLRSAKNERERAGALESRVEAAEERERSLKEDLSQARLNASNFEAQFQAEKLKVAELEKDIKRLEYNLESAAMEGSSHSVQDGQLQSRLKAAEEDARRARMELAQLQAQHAAGAGSSSPRRSRRRASSFNGADMPSVAGERDAAAGAMREAETKIETLERKLSAAVRERDQAVNAKMALQKKAEKEIEEAKDRAMELQYELDAGAFGAERPSNILKQNTKLKADLQDALANLQAVEGSKQALQAEIDDLRSQPPPATDSDLHEARIAELNERIATLQVELEESRARSPTADDKSSDPSTSQLQRELKAAKRRLEVKEREIATLEQDLLDSNEEVEALRRGGAQVQDHTDDKAARITELEERIASVTAELEAVRSETEAQHAELELQLSKATDDLETTRTTMGTERQRLEAELETSISDREKAVAEAQARVAQLEERVESCTAQLAEAVRAHSESQELAGSVQKERDQLNLSLAEKDRQIEALNEKCEGLVTEVASHKEDVEALESARKQLVMFEQRISDLQQQQSSDDGAAVRLSKASKEVSQLRDKVEALQTSMSEMESHLNAEIEALSAQLAEKDEQLSTLKEAAALDLSVKADAERMAAELEAKGVALKSSVDELTALESQLAQMTSTIQRLRSDRDDLKSQLRFAEAETRVGTESEQQTAAERDSLQARVLALEGDVESLTAITSERDDLADAIKIVEHEREVAQQEVKDLRQQLSEMESKHSDTLQDEQERRRKAETRVEELLLSATISEMPEDEKRKEVKALYERIDRREARIKVLTNDLKKLNMNYTVAQDDLKDLNEELESVQNAVKQAKEAETQAVQALTEVRTLEAKAQEELQSSRASETQLQDELSAERTKLAAKEETITQCEARLAAIENDYNTAKQAALEETRDLVLAIAIYRKGIDSATEHGIASERSLQASIARVAQLEAEQAALLQQGSSINELREQVAESQEQLKAAELVAQELAAVKLERDVLDSRIAELETELSASNSARSEVETKAALLEKELIDANNSLASARAEHESAVAEHSRRMVEAENSSDARTAELNAQHEAALEEAERRLQDAKAQVETELAVISEQLKTTQEEVATLSKRVKDLSHSLDMTTAEREAAIVRAEELAQTAGLVDGLQAEVSRLESELSEMTMARNAHASRIDDLAAELSDAMADQAALNEELSSVSADNEALREKEAQLLEEMDAQVAALESEKVKVIESQAALAAAEKENRSSASRLRFMESQVKELTQRIADLRDDLDAVNSGSSTATRAAAEKDEEIARLKKERTSLKSEVEALNEDLQRAYASLTTKTNEIEDADDRQQELSKEISRQKKRVAKLERQNKSLLSELETTRNTLDNVSPARTSVSHIAPLSSTFELSATAAGTPKHKRTRDEEERSVPREVWVQGEPAPIGKPDKSPAISRSPLALRAAAGSNRPTVERPIAGLAKKKTSSFSVAARLAVLERRGGSGLADAR